LNDSAILSDSGENFRNKKEIETPLFDAPLEINQQETLAMKK
jgi:hypothetical protein